MDTDIMKRSSSEKTFTQEIQGTVSQVIRQIKKLIKEGNARRLIVEDQKGKVLFQTQLTAGIAGTALITAMAPIISAISMFALFMNDVKIIVERYPEEETDSEKDEFEVEAEVIDVKDEGEDGDEGEENEMGSGPEKKQAKTEKTVGKDKKDNE
ncbi:MAG: DUF4342 domain-containing protein [Balneolaceae bacterium]